MRRLLAVFLLALIPSSAFAHALGVDCVLRGGKIEVEAFYDDDTPAQKAKVRVVSGKDEIVTEGVTDEKGCWEFAALPPGTYEVRVDAGAGHRAKKTITIPPPAPAHAEQRPAPIGTGPTRAEFTEFPWLRGLIGVLAIAGLAGALSAFLQYRKRCAPEGPGGRRAMGPEDALRFAARQEPRSPGS